MLHGICRCSKHTYYLWLSFCWAPNYLHLEGKIKFVVYNSTVCGKWPFVVYELFCLWFIKVRFVLWFMVMQFSKVLSLVYASCIWIVPSVLLFEYRPNTWRASKDYILLQWIMCRIRQRQYWTAPEWLTRQVRSSHYSRCHQYFLTFNIKSVFHLHTMTMRLATGTHRVAQHRVRKNFTTRAARAGRRGCGLSGDTGRRGRSNVRELRRWR